MTESQPIAAASVGGGGEESRYADELEQILRCAVCLDRVKDPRILPCQHTFCASPCLEGLIDGSRVLRCPECREQYLAPPGGVRQLPSNRVIANLLELAAVAAGEEDQQPQTAQTTAGGSPRDAAAAAGRRCRACTREDVQAFALCLHCKKQICVDCKAAHLRQLRLDVSLLVGRVRRQLPGVADRIAEVNSVSSAVHANADKLRAEIGSLFERLTSGLRARESALLDELRQHEEDQIRRTRVLRAEYDSALARATEFCDALEERLREAAAPGGASAEPSEVDAVAYHRQCVDQLKHLEQFDRQAEELRPPALRFRRSRCLDIVETCEVGSLVPATGPAPSDPVPAILGTAAATLEPLERLPPRGSTPIAGGGRLHEAAPAPLGFGLAAAVRSLSLPPPLAAGPGGSGVDASALAPLDSTSLLLRHLMSPAGGLSQTDHADASSPFETVRRAFEDYMRAVRPFVSPTLTESYAGGLLPFTGISGGEAHSSDFFPRGLEDVSAAAGDGGGYLLRMPPDATAGLAVRAYGDDDTVMRDDSVRDDSLGPGGSTVTDVDGGIAEQPQPQPPQRPRGFLSVVSRLERRGGTQQPDGRGGALIDYHRKVMPSFKIGARGTECGSLTWPRGVAASPINDTVIVADSGNQRVQVFDRQGRFVHAFGSYGQADGQFDTPTGVAATSSGYIIVSDRYNNRLLVFDAYGDYVRRIGGPGADAGQLSQPWGLACDRRDRVYVCDKGNHRVQVFGLAGEFVRSFGRFGEGDGELNSPNYLCVSADDERVVVSDSGNNRIQVFTAAGEYLTAFGSEGSAAGQLRRPRGVAVDAQGYVVVADSGNNRVQVFRQDGGLHWVFGSWGQGDGSMKGVEGLALNSCGQIVVVDRDNHRVQVF